MNELKDKELEKVIGGTGRSKTICVCVDYGNDKIYKEDVTIIPYLNGEIIRSQVKTVDCSVTKVNININGSGKGVLKVKINNDIVKMYELDFDTRTYIEL